MASRKIDLMIKAIKTQNEYDYKIQEEKQRITRNISDFIKSRNKKEKIKKEIIKDININNNDNIIYKTKDPLESVEYNSKPLIPIIKDQIYNYKNVYNFNRKNVIKQNNENRMKINKSLDNKLSLYTINKNNYMNNIRTLFSQRNALTKKKTEIILEHIKQSNDELRKNINLKQARRYNNFINFLKMKNLENKNYNDELNKKMKLAKYKYDININKKLKEIKNNLDKNEILIKNKNSISTNDMDIMNQRLMIKKEEIKENNEKIKNKIIEKEKKYFLRAKNKEDEINERKNKAIINEQNNNKMSEIKLDEAKEIYEKIYKSEVIYKKEKL